MSTVLVVEDNGAFRQSFVELLEDAFPSVNVCEAGDGKDALQKVHDLVPDLIFMDIKLPDENGLELTKRIKKDFPKIPIIVLTSYDVPEYRQAALTCGAEYFFSKGSVGREEILKVIESLIPS